MKRTLLKILAFGPLVLMGITSMILLHKGASEGSFLCVAHLIIVYVSLMIMISYWAYKKLN